MGTQIGIWFVNYLKKIKFWEKKIVSNKAHLKVVSYDSGHVSFVVTYVSKPHVEFYSFFVFFFCGKFQQGKLIDPS